MLGTCDMHWVLVFSWSMALLLGSAFQQLRGGKREA